MDFKFYEMNSLTIFSSSGTDKALNPQGNNLNTLGRGPSLKLSSKYQKLSPKLRTKVKKIFFFFFFVKNKTKQKMSLCKTKDPEGRAIFDHIHKVPLDKATYQISQIFTF